MFGKAVSSSGDTMWTQSDTQTELDRVKMTQSLVYSNLCNSCKQDSYWPQVIHIEVALSLI